LLAIGAFILRLFEPEKALPYQEESLGILKAVNKIPRCCEANGITIHLQLRKKKSDCLENLGEAKIVQIRKEQVAKKKLIAPSCCRSFGGMLQKPVWDSLRIN